MIKLAGHSMGGKTAMAAALRYPEIIEGLVVVDVSPHKAPGERESTDLIKAMKNLDLSSLTNRREADAVLKNDIKVGGIFNPKKFPSIYNNIIRSLPIMELVRCMPGGREREILTYTWK